MHVEIRDWRPGSMLDRPTLTALAMLVGTVTGVLGFALLVVVIFADLGVTLGVDAADSEAEEEAAADDEPEIIEAAFVQLGREFRPRELPDRQVATSSLAPRTPDPHAVSKRIVDPRDQPDQPPPPSSYEDMLTQLGNTSRFVDSNFAAETEGDPDGNEEGRFSRDGSVYLGQLQALVKRGWRVPASIPDSELVSLRAAVSFRITEDLRMEDLRLSVRSGNADYDRSIEQRLEEMRQSAFRVPPPPPEERGRFIGTPITFNMLPPANILRDARQRLDRRSSDDEGAESPRERSSSESEAPAEPSAPPPDRPSADPSE